jgi:hypothetical protein
MSAIPPCVKLSAPKEGPSTFQSGDHLVLDRGAGEEKEARSIAVDDAGRRGDPPFPGLLYLGHDPGRVGNHLEPVFAQTMHREISTVVQGGFGLETRAHAA